MPLIAVFTPLTMKMVPLLTSWRKWTYLYSVTSLDGGARFVIEWSTIDDV